MSRALIQLSISPRVLVTKEKVVSITNIDDIYQQKDFLNNVNEIIINVGPGSYTSIRQSIAFAIGLNHGEGVKISTFTSFDFIKHYIIYANLVKAHSQLCVFLQSWPRHIPKTSSDLPTLKGYVALPTGEFKFMTLQELLEKNYPTIVYLQNLQLAKLYVNDLKKVKSVILPEQLSETKFLQSFLNNFKFSTSDNIKPLYINPVNITKPKKP